MSPKHAFIDLPLLNCVYLHNGIEWLWNVALWDSPKIETRDTSHRLIFMSVLGKINGAFSHCIMLFNGATHLIKREHFWNIYVFCFLHMRRPSGPVQIFPSAWLQFLRCRLFYASWWMILLSSILCTISCSSNWCFEKKGSEQSVSILNLVCFHLKQ